MDLHGWPESDHTKKPRDMQHANLKRRAARRAKLQGLPWSDLLIRVFLAVAFLVTWGFGLVDLLRLRSGYLPVINGQLSPDLLAHSLTVDALAGLLCAVPVIAIYGYQYIKAKRGSGVHGAAKVKAISLLVLLGSCALLLILAFVIRRFF